MGGSTALVSITDGAGSVFSQTLNPGDQFTVTSPLVNDKFNGNSVMIKVGGVFNVAIDVNCTLSFDPGAMYGSFKMIAATSKTGGALCCSSNITDTQAPVISGCPGNLVATTSATQCFAVVSWAAPTATDCELQSLTSNFNPGAQFPIGVTTVTYTATDANNNTTTCNFTVTVNDVPPAVANCPGNITVTAVSACTATVTWTPPTFTDNCSVTVTSTHLPGAAFPIGVTTVTYSGKDSNNNTTNCSFTVTVNDVPPVVSNCPTDISITATSACTATASWTPPTFTDNCSVTVTSTHTPGAAFPIGVTTVTYTGKDNNNNTTTCSFKVTVVDTPPVVSNCPSDITVTATSACSPTVTWAAPSFNDNCGAINLTTSKSPGSGFPIGVTTVTYTATDANNNVTTCSFKVTVIDPPPVVSNCPADITAMADATCSAIATWTPPTFTDNCGPVTVTASHTPGSSFQLGTTPVTYTGKDGAGNTTVCTFNVLVKDNLAPVISGCPANIQLTLTNSSGETAIDWTPPTVTDNCAVTLTSSHHPGDSFDIGTTEVQYTAVDNSGNTTTCSFTVTIIYEALPLEISALVTPDGNGENDTWLVGNIDKYESNSVVIADRWGGVVFTTSGYNNTTHVWDGRNSSGGLVPTGTYFFVLSVQTPVSVVKKQGFIELVR